MLPSLSTHVMLDRQSVRVWSRRLVLVDVAVALASHPYRGTSRLNGDIAERNLDRISEWAEGMWVVSIVVDRLAVLPL